MEFIPDTIYVIMTKNKVFRVIYPESINFFYSVTMINQVTQVVTRATWRIMHTGEILIISTRVDQVESRLTRNDLGQIRIWMRCPRAISIIIFVIGGPGVMGERGIAATPVPGAPVGLRGCYVMVTARSGKAGGKRPVADQVKVASAPAPDNGSQPS